MKRAGAFANGTDVQFALRRWRELVKSPTFLAIVGAVSVIWAVNDISIHAALSEMLVLFLMRLLFAGVSASVASLGILVWVGILRLRFSTMPRYVLAGVLSSPLVFVSLAGLTALIDQKLPTAETLLNMFISVVVTVTAIAAIVGIVNRRTNVAAGQIATGTSPQAHADNAFVTAPEVDLPDLVRRLPAELGQEIIRLSASDHYVEVYTRLGHTLVLLRFSDALKELGAADGVQIHRSHWVARSAIHRLVSKGRNLFVELDDGTVLPVSRSRFGEIRSAGFVEERVS
ncbi:LytTR family DNA-binding domain-containing protein [Thalassospira sp. TSL5-1]|uniref:LytTR family DNA-binding domain-containing protein n=1 Tax=Thalassospira sp. TSL5-1 TaxID=1544451 RepID=UPI00143BA1DC|nr:LytTR family DNA-binding domain-containing protein [Thalassospira sp. TSL5-1]